MGAVTKLNQIKGYYTSLGLFVISVPGLWSLIKRSVKSKVVQKAYVKNEGGGAPPNQVAGEILSFFTRNNFAVADRGETITFEGMMVPSRGQAALLTFCTCISLGSVALVLSIAVPEGGNNWFWLTALSPLAGVYYWTKASRKEEIKVKMIVGEDGSLSEIVVRGDDEQVERMRKELGLSEKGMVYVKGIFERQ
ncbi:protein COFACTOR ASSEMBLY OF COMPLEX C SUBUNIT B CCB1, chloroplastic [Asparagus officinalis]|uniref:protein COFACTOR ASSEMBLY OF COMPLEX C SUBUNIT B CCB1, chloroplastic n=1 Tax=Asparagus officinalis TaxID=4686 RepID=UPI00098E1373|nr:protein COFACTOR ASSEMBLY OF COMPLEX C SUBUNIT B CCB1, chloroplastic [Asparagus officinalis]